MQECQLYKQKEDNSVQCTACAWQCAISENSPGICGVRKNLGGKLFLLVYGKPCSVQIDPVEKKPVFHFLPGSKIFSLGTLGCNFACSFCQNWGTSQALRENKKEDVEKRLEHAPVSLLPEDIVTHCIEQKIPAIAFTYNEPAIFFEYAFDTIQLAQKHGIKTVFVSNGFESGGAIEKLSPVLDAINIDLKSFNPEFYQKTCKAQLYPVLETIKAFAQSPVWVEITTLIIPGKNDSETELTKIAEFIASLSKDIPWHISAFHPDYKMTDVSSTQKAILDKAFEIGKKVGLNYIYVGNVSDTERATTYCPGCKKPLIKRDYYKILENNLCEGACSFCKEKIVGVWA